MFLDKFWFWSISKWKLCEIEIKGIYTEIHVAVLPPLPHLMENLCKTPNLRNHSKKFGNNCILSSFANKILVIVKHNMLILSKAFPVPDSWGSPCHSHSLWSHLVELWHLCLKLSAATVLLAMLHRCFRFTISPSSIIDQSLTMCIKGMCKQAHD